MPLDEFQCIFLEKAANEILNYFVFYTLLITKSSFEIGSLPAKVTKDKFYISAHKVL